MSKTGHRVLVVEDDPVARDIVCDILRSRGDSPRAVATVEEALAAIEEEEVCYFVLDQQLPADASALKSYIAGGQRVIEAARQVDRRRTAADAHVTPILALTGYPGGKQWVAGLFELGVTAYIEKPVEEQMELFLDKVRSAMERAGRADHAQCAALAQRGSAPAEKVEAPALREVRIAIAGTAAKGGRSHIEINGVQRDMPDKRFLSVVLAVFARERSSEGWSSRDELEIGPSRSATTQIREAFEGLIPEGFEVLEADRRGNFRLNPQVVVERIDLDRLLEHPDPGVVRVVREHRKRGANRQPR